MATTTRGIIYPTSSDNIAPLETHFANLANSVDTALGTVSGSIPASVVSGAASFTGPAAAAASVSVTVTFPTAFTAIPKVVATVQGAGSVTPHVVTIAGSPSITGFSATVYKIAGTTAESLVLNWMAKV
jgi:hypothetical protein